MAFLEQLSHKMLVFLSLANTTNITEYRLVPKKRLLTDSPENISKFVK